MTEFKDIYDEMRSKAREIEQFLMDRGIVQPIYEAIERQRTGTPIERIEKLEQQIKELQEGKQ